MAHVLTLSSPDDAVSKYVPTAGTLLGFRNQSCSTAGPIARTPGTTWTYWRITVRDVLADGSSVAEVRYCG